MVWSNLKVGWRSTDLHWAQLFPCDFYLPYGTSKLTWACSLIKTANENTSGLRKAMFRSIHHHFYIAVLAKASCMSIPKTKKQQNIFCLSVCVCMCGGGGDRRVDICEQYSNLLQ